MARAIDSDRGKRVKPYSTKLIEALLPHTKHRHAAVRLVVIAALELTLTRPLTLTPTPTLTRPLTPPLSLTLTPNQVIAALESLLLCGAGQSVETLVGWRLKNNAPRGGVLTLTPTLTLTLTG